MKSFVTRLAPAVFFAFAAPAQADDLAETSEIIWSDSAEPALLDKADELQTAPTIYEYVRNHFEYVIYEGARSNSTNVFAANRGNDVDIASVLIAMLRSRGIPARYAVGKVRIPGYHVANWIKTIDEVIAVNSLLWRVDSNGIWYTDGFEFDHVWVQAHVPMGDYRAAGAATAIDCDVDPGKCSWVDLDASFKFHDLPDPLDLVDTESVVFFDYQAYYHAEDATFVPTDGIERGQKGPTEIYEEQITEYLRTTSGLEGKTLEDVVYDGPILPESHGILPASLPYRNTGSISTYDSVAEHDAAPTTQWAKYVTFALTFPDIPELTGISIPLTNPLSLADLSTKSLALTLESTDFATPSIPKKMIVRLDGVIVQELFSITDQNFTYAGGTIVFSGTPPGTGSPFDLHLELDGNNGVGNGMGSPGKIVADYPRLTMGGYFLVAVGGEMSNYGQAHRAAKGLLQANDTYPTMECSQVLYVDANRNGCDASDTPLLEHAAAQAALTAGVLELAKSLYYAETRIDGDRIRQLQQSIGGISGFLGVVSSVHDVHAVDGTAFSIIPAGLLVDMKGLMYHADLKISEPLTFTPRTFRLEGHAASANEHEVWQSITGYETISTMQGIQKTVGNNATLMFLPDPAIPIAQVLANFGFETSFPSANLNYVWLDLLGLRLFLPHSDDATERTLDILREVIDASSTNLEKTPWSLVVDDTGSDLEAFFVWYADYRDYLQGLLDDGYTEFPDPVEICPTQPSSKYISTLLNTILPNCFWDDVNANQYIEDYTLTFDQNNGFVIGNFVYREYDLANARHIGIYSLAPIRDEVILGVGGGDTVEYVIPNEIARGELLDLAVWIRRLFDSSGDEYYAAYIINRAGGGYVSGVDTYDIYDPFDITWSNDTFWEDSLNSIISNSVFGPSTFDPISTVSGNMYHDAQDLRIRGRGGLDYVFTRTYNSNLTDSDTIGAPMGQRWTHSYNMRLIARDYGREPNSTDPRASDGVVSSITYVDERAGEHLFSNCAERLERLEAGSPTTTGWIDVECPLGTLGAGNHTITIGTYNNQKTTSNEVTQIYIDDVVVQGDGATSPIFEAHFDTDAESFVYIDDAFGTSEPNYASGSYTSSGGQTGGGLRVDVGGIDETDVNDMSGGWRRTFNLVTATSVTIRYSYNLNQDPAYDAGEYSDAMLAADGVAASPFDLALWKVVNPRGTFDTLDLSNAAANEYVVQFRNGTEYVFGDADLTQIDAVARLVKIRDPYGNELNFVYTGLQLTSITDNLGIAGRTGLTLTYDGNDRLKTVSDWDSPVRTWTYGYDTSGNLVTAQNPLGEITTYQYDSDAPTLVAILKDLDGDATDETLTTFDYYENGRAFGNANAFGDGESVEYDLFRKRTRITDPRGFVTNHHYDRNGELVKLTRANGGIQTYESQSNGRRFKKTNYQGYETLYSYCAAKATDGCSSDSGGNVTLEQDALGNTVEYDYDTGLFDAIVRIKQKDGSIRLSTYYPADDPPSGAVRGKLQKVEMETLGGLSNVLLGEYKYNPDGTLDEQIEYIDPGSTTRWRKTSYAYDPASNGLNVTSITVSGSDLQTATTSYTYDNLGRLSTESVTRSTSPSNSTPITLTTTYEYDDLDRVIRVTDPLGNEGETDYYPNGLLKETRIRYKKPDLSFDVRVVEQRTYDDANRLIAVTDINGGVTSTEYDEAGNVTRVTGPTGTSTSFEYDSVGNRIAIMDENGHHSTSKYDVDGRLLETTDANGNSTTYVYDELGRMTERVDALGYTTQFAYDGMGRVTKEIDANAVGVPARQNSYGASVYRKYDELGRLVKVVDALDEATLFEYDLLGNRTKVTDAEGGAATPVYDTRFVTDDLGRLTEIIDPIVEAGTDKTVTFEYDEIGNLIRKTDREGNQAEYTYDKLNRLEETSLVASGRVFDRSYDLYGNLESLTTPEITKAYLYDNKNRLTQVADQRLGKSLSFVYDAADRMIEKTDYQGDVTKYVYDSSGRLIAEQNPSYLEAAYHYDSAGRLLDRLLSNGASTQYRWDAGDRLTSLTNKSADGTIVSAFSYLHDKMANITSSDDGASTTTYAYDLRYRLKDADLPNTVDDQVYTYDAVGNRKTLTENSQTYFYCYDATDCSAAPVGNRLMNIRIGSGTGTLHRQFTYDDNGAVTGKQDDVGAAIYTLGRGDLGRVTSASGPGFSNTFGYEVGGLRVRRNDSGGSDLFHLEGAGLEAVYDGSSGELRAKYLRGAIIDEVVNGYQYDANGTPTNYTYHHDSLTSVVGLSGHTGTVDETTTYAPFGATLSGATVSENPLRFTGREQDPDTGLYYYRARYYDPEIGRFLSEDPIGFSGGINFYAYVGNNPVNFNDPMGEDVVYAGGQVGGAVGGAGGSGQVAIGFDLNGNILNPFDYYLIETGAAGGQSNVASYSGVVVGGYSTVDNPMDLAGPSGLVGGSGGIPNLVPMAPTVIGGVDVVLGSNYTSYEGSVGIGGSFAMPVELHGMAAYTSVQNVGDMIVDFFTGGSSSNQIESVYQK